MDEQMNNQTPTPEEQPQQQAPPPEAQPEPPSTVAQNEQGVTEELSKDAKMWAMLCHLGALAMYLSIPFANILGPLIIWLIKKDEFEFVDDQGTEALNFQISVSIYMVACTPLICLAGTGAFLIAGIAIADLVFIIIAAISANKGQRYRYPCCIRMVK